MDMESVDFLMATRLYNMFWPKNREDLLITYPELRKFKELQAVSDNTRKLLFVYFFACKWSPAQFLQSEAERIELSLRAAWGNQIPKEIDAPYRNKAWGPVMQAAITRMRAFEPEVHVRMKLIFKRSMERVTRLLEADDSNTPKSWKEKREFFDALKVGLSILHDHQKYIEEGAFGVTDVTDDQFDDFGEGEVMEELMRESRSSNHRT